MELDRSQLLYNEDLYGHWHVFPDFVETKGGFTYYVENIITGEKYIGRKYFDSIRRKRVKNRKNRKVVRNDSGWRSYTTSSEYVNANIEKYGKDKHFFVILAVYDTRGQTNFAEMELLFKNDVLASDEWLNATIGKYRAPVVNKIQGFLAESRSRMLFESGPVFNGSEGRE